MQGVRFNFTICLLQSATYLMKYMKINWRLKMNEKYPLTRDIEIDKPNNADEFLWWKQPVARNVLMIFWSGIIPFVFILKYALHIF